MRLYGRIIASSIILSFCFLILFTVLYFLAFPLEEWQSLWTEKVWEVPFVILVPTMTIIFGCVIGIVLSLVIQKRVSMVEEKLSMILKSKPISTDITFDELDSLFDKLIELQSFLQEKTKRTQRLIEERVEGQEEKINQVISEERNRLARELHDSVSQELFAASMLVSAVNATKTEKDALFSKQLNQIEAIIHQSQLEMRALLLHLRPILLKNKTLKEGIEQLLTELKAKVPISVIWHIEDVAANKGVEDQLFRILQEAFSNALRHAKADQIDVSLIERDEFIILKVEDDGIGFQVEEKKSGSYGLTNMQERSLEIGGHLRIVSIPDKGTRLEVRVPNFDKNQ
ncbi:sensor histidine kinase [Gracilibacillus sp. YIM 98692]|uniref:sensor histidine kinase n=1 Tax=Gracilibacillus sp. YIM 98692 TaxID=2663532 RepID=UPI0013D48EF6|nr:sensor histidine kinase [Gracilibacillus sp. YIM 98692]